MTDNAEAAAPLPPLARTRRLSADVVLYRSGAALARRLPQPVGAALTGAISRAAYRLLPERRFITERRLQRVCGPELQGEALAQAVRASFESYARYWYDGARIGDLDDAEVEAGFSHQGFHHIQEAIDTGTAPILALPHLGGWEWAGTWMARVPATE